MNHVQHPPEMSWIFSLFDNTRRFQLLSPLKQAIFFPFNLI